eukprot:356778-Chlamydomonas_euryale.AAC.3
MLAGSPRRLPKQTLLLRPDTAGNACWLTGCDEAQVAFRIWRDHREACRAANSKHQGGRFTSCRQHMNACGCRAPKERGQKMVRRKQAQRMFLMV